MRAVTTKRLQMRRKPFACAFRLALVSLVASGLACSTARPVHPDGSTDDDDGEPAAIDTIFIDQFESGALSDAGRWQDIYGDGWSIASAATEGVPAVSGMKILKVQPTGGAITHFVATGSSSPYENLRFSYWMYRRAGYESGGLRSGSIKGSRDQWGSFGNAGSCPDSPTHSANQEYFAAALTQSSSDWKLRMYNYWLDQQKQQESPPLCYGSSGLRAGDSPQAVYHDLSFAPQADRWYHYEIELHLNTPGQADGWEKVWIDGVLTIEHTNVRYRTDPLTRIWVVRFDVGSTTVGTAYFDDVVVTVER